MALLRILGFESANNGEIVTTLPTGVTIDTTSPSGGGGRSLKNDGTHTASNIDFYSNLDSAPALGNSGWYTFRFRVDSATPGSDHFFRLLAWYDSTVTLMCYINVAHQSGTGTFFIQAANSASTLVINTAASEIVSGSWVDARVQITPTSTKIWLNGTLYDSGTITNYSSGVTTRYFSGFTKATSDSARPMWIDDICIWDADPGGVPWVIARQFSANSSVSNTWTAVGGANKYSNVSETPFSATNAVSSATSGAVQLFVPNSFSSTETGKGSGVITSGTHQIMGAKMSFVAKTSATSAGGATMSLRWRDSSAANTDYSFTNLTTADRYYDKNSSNSVNSGVNGGGIFTPTDLTDLNASEFGLVHGANTRTQTVEDLWVHVAFMDINGVVLTADAGSFALTGTAAGTKRGRKVGAGAGTFALTGTAATVRKGYKVVADAGSFALTGEAATLRHGWKIGAGVGTFALTGTAATLRENRRLPADAGTFALTGTAAILRRGLTLTAASDTFTLTGEAATLRHAWKVTADAGSFTLTGFDATLTKASNKRLAADAEAFSLTGTAAGLRKGWTVGAATEAFNLSGEAATLALGRKLVAEAGSFALTGSAAGLRKGANLVASSGSFTLTGQDATLRKGWKVTAEEGTFTLTGSAAALVKTGVTILLAETGRFALTGQAASLLRGFKLTADTAAFSLVGTEAAFTRGEAVIVPPGGDSGEGAKPFRDPDSWWKKSPGKKARKTKTTTKEAPTEAPSSVSEADIAAREALEAEQRAKTALTATAITEAELEAKRLDEEAALLLLLAA